MQLFTATFANRYVVVLQWQNWALAAHHQRATILTDGITMYVFLCVYVFDCFNDVNRFNYALFFSVQFQSQSQFQSLSIVPSSPAADSRT